MLFYGLPNLLGIFAVLDDTKPVHFLLMYCNTIKWFHKKLQVYDPKTEMVIDAQFLCLNVNNSYNHNMNSVDLSDPLQNVYQFDHCMHKYKWWWYILFRGHELVLVNAQIIFF